MSARWGPDFVLITDNGIYANEWDLKNLTANKYNKININTLCQEIQDFYPAHLSEKGLLHHIITKRVNYV